MTRFPEQELFLRADAAIAGVVERLTPEQLARSAPSGWTQRFESPTVGQIVLVHAHDEAFVPDMLAGRTVAEVGERWDEVLQASDPVAAHAAQHARATDAASAELDPAATVRFSYGDYPVREALAHLSTYRAFQAWLIGHLLGLDVHLSPELVDGLNAHVMPHADEWRQWGVFPPAIEPPADADDEVRLLCAAGYWAS